MSAPLSDPSLLATTSLACPICSDTFRKRKELLHYPGTSFDKTFRYDASTPENASRLFPPLGVLPCPLACGALFDGGTTGSSTPLDAHIARGTCRARRLGPLPAPRKMCGPYLSTTTRGITAVLASLASQARLYPISAPMNSATVTFSLDHPDFAASHMKMSGAQTAATLPTPTMSQRTPVIACLVNRALSTRGSLLRHAA